LGWTDRDPTAGVRGYKSKEIHTWNESEIAIFERHWPEGTRERLTFALLLYTGQRGSDVYRMTWADITDGAIRVAQQKTTTKLTIPIHEALERVLSIANRGHSTILATAYGERFSVKGFGQMISVAIRGQGSPSAAKPMGSEKLPLGGWPRPAAPQARSRRSPGTRPWPRSSDIREQQIKNDWRDKRSSGSPIAKVANCKSAKWQTPPPTP